MNHPTPDAASAGGLEPVPGGHDPGAPADGAAREPPPAAGQTATSSGEGGEPHGLHGSPLLERLEDAWRLFWLEVDLFWESM